jgi:dephospho-CoA kinase
MIIGLTGGYCAGKNAVADILAKEGWACIDVDKLGHEAIEMGRDSIVRRFGTAVLAGDGRLDRRALARIVFSDRAALADQEAIVHPIAIRLLDEAVTRLEAAARAAGREPRICVNAALLHRTERIAACDSVIEVRASLPVRVARGMRRDGTGVLATLRRITRQRGFRAALRTAARAAGKTIVVVRNAGSIEKLETETLRALGKLASLYA